MNFSVKTVQDCLDDHTCPLHPIFSIFSWFFPWKLFKLDCRIILVRSILQSSSVRIVQDCLDDHPCQCHTIFSIFHGSLKLESCSSLHKYFVKTLDLNFHNVMTVASKTYCVTFTSYISWIYPAKPSLFVFLP